MKNLEIAEIFHSMAQILEIQGENVFRIRAYERAAQTLGGIENIDDYAKDDRLTEIPGIGQDLSAKIKEYIQTGKIRHYEDLKKKIPEGILELLDVPSLGPKTVKLFYEKLKIKNIATLEKFAKQGRLLGLEGIKEKTVENILKGIALMRRGKERIDIATAWEIAGRFVKELEKVKEIKKIAVAGSLRRMKETAKDIDILAISTKPNKVMDAFCNCADVKEVIAKGKTKTSILSKDGIQVDVRVVRSDSFGAALLYFTGSKNHNIRLRTLAVRRRLKINEYGIFSAKGGSAYGGRDKKCLASKTEKEIYNLLDMQYIEPELREDRSEIEAALEKNLPKLIELKEIRGDFHVHSTYSDGKSTISEIAYACKSKGYEYVVLTDHSESLKVAHGLSIQDLRRKKKEIERLNKEFKNFVILFGTEAEIDSQGNMDYNNKVLKDFDFVVAAIHSGFKQPKEQLTRRIVKACQNPNVDIIAHPTGRLWGTRDSYELNFEEVFKAAKETNTFLEINAFPDRLDLGDVHIKAAREKGVKFVISTDSHAVSHLDYMKLGVAMARRGWLRKQDVINTLPLSEIMKIKK